MNTLLGVTESDGFAIAMLAILVTSFSFVLVILVGVIRHARKHSKESEELPGENADAQDDTKPEPWNKPADWWKGDA
ncbi:hypothetical protein ACFQY0_17490 [Haloferula chungangensis]|uniref:Uncharacterized protein n=1 Tax=Haloferula chungangensis TaxID=1048331 RepID=A0ABW2LB19_9BACT